MIRRWNTRWSPGSVDLMSQWYHQEPKVLFYLLLCLCGYRMATAILEITSRQHKIQNMEKAIFLYFFFLGVRKPFSTASNRIPVFHWPYYTFFPKELLPWGMGLSQLIEYSEFTHLEMEMNPTSPEAHGCKRVQLKANKEGNIHVNTNFRKLKRSQGRSRSSS